MKSSLSGARQGTSMRRTRRRGSMLLMVLFLCTTMIHATLRAQPLWSKVIARSLQRERAYRMERMNEGLRRFRAKCGRSPHRLDELVTVVDGDGPFIPRVYPSPSTGKVDWLEKLDEDGGIVSLGEPVK